MHLKTMERLPSQKSVSLKGMAPSLKINVNLLINYNYSETALT